MTRHLAFLRDSGFDDKLRSMYRASYARAQKIDKRLARVVFDGRRNRAGWTIPKLDLLLSQQAPVENLLQDADSIRREFSHFVFSGMGGSSVGARILARAYRSRRLHCLTSTDPGAVARILDRISARSNTLAEGLRNTVVFVTSRKNTTIETTCHQDFFKKLFQRELRLGQRSTELRRHIWYFTERPTDGFPRRGIQLDGITDVSGGRYYAPTARPFLFPLALLAPDAVWRTLERARAMNDVWDTERDIFLRLACFLHHHESVHGKNKLTLFMSPRLRELTLAMELIIEHSINRNGRSIACFAGESLRVADLRPVDEDERVYLRVRLRGEFPGDGPWSALTASGYPTFDIVLDGPADIGGFLMGIQRAVVAIAYLWNVSASKIPRFTYKKKTAQLLAQPAAQLRPPRSWEYSSGAGIRLYHGPLQHSRAVPFPELVAAISDLGGGPRKPAETLAALLYRLYRTDSPLRCAEIGFYGDPTPALAKGLALCRRTLFTQLLHIPCKITEGPMRNHTHQDGIEYGADEWLTLVVLPLRYRQTRPVRFPGRLNKALALATVDALTARRRQAILITLTGSPDDASNDWRSFCNATVERLRTLMSTST